jgi:hypothetical protein
MVNLNGCVKEVFATSGEVYKRPVPIKISDPLIKDTLVDTLHGPVEAPIGFRIATGIRGEEYPIPPEVFAQYQEIENNLYTKKKVVVKGKQLSFAGYVSNSWGETLNTSVGDWLIMEAENNAWVVGEAVFNETYSFMDK